MNQLLKYCRYYKSEEKCPESIEKIQMGTIWFYEQLWVESDELRDKNGYNTREYIAHGMQDFNTDDGTPLTLKALLYNRHTHWCGGFEIENDKRSFMEWYNKYYIGKSQPNP